MKRLLVSGAIIAALLTLVVLSAAQLVPYGRDHRNPQVSGEPNWDRPQTRELAWRACGDCHSNETNWPWYSNVAPVSWLVQRDVDEGRDELNFSEWRRSDSGDDDLVESVLDGEMPPWFYEILHPEATLSEAEKADLIRGFEATFGLEGDRGRKSKDD